MAETQTAAADLAHADIGIVCALPIELGAFLDRCQKVKKYTGGDFVFRGGLYDETRDAVVSEDFLLALLGEAHHQAVDVLLRAGRPEARLADQHLPCLPAREVHHLA